MNFRPIFFLIIILAVNISEASEWLTSEFKEKNIYSVADRMTDKTSLSLWVAGTAATLYLRDYDTDYRNQWKDHQQMSASVADAGNILGSGIATAGIIAGQYYWDSDKENWKSHARAFAWETVTVTALKYTFGKQRPGDKNSYVSYPSGHTSTAFATATSLTYAYGWKAGVLAYPLAALVGASRMADDMHWISDVVAGAFVGIIIGRAASADYDPHSQLSWMPVLGPGELSLNCIYRF